MLLLWKNLQSDDLILHNFLWWEVECRGVIISSCLYEHIYTVSRVEVEVTVRKYCSGDTCLLHGESPPAPETPCFRCDGTDIFRVSNSVAGKKHEVVSEIILPLLITIDSTLTGIVASTACPQTISDLDRWGVVKSNQMRPANSLKQRAWVKKSTYGDTFAKRRRCLVQFCEEP